MYDEASAAGTSIACIRNGAMESESFPPSAAMSFCCWVSLTPGLNVTRIDAVCPLGEGEGVGDGDSVGDGDGDSVGDGVGEGDSVGDGEGDGDSVGDGEGDGEDAKARVAGGPTRDASSETTTTTDRKAVTVVCRVRVGSIR